MAALDGVERSAPFDLLSFPPESKDRFIGTDGQITLTYDDIDWLRL